MQVKSLFSKDINRSINGVVKVAQTDEEATRQELSEYVITRELQRHFADFFESYTRAIDVPTDKIGVWISGFFGSGKSHFLKMLSYLLSNQEVGGRQAIDYFDGKVADPLVYSQMRRACSVPTEAILFNIDNKGGQWKEGAEAKTALLRSFARVFYEHRGFYGEDLKLARLEQFVERARKTGEFRAAFERINGASWLEARSDYVFFEDDVVETLVEVLGMSREAAQHWFDGTESDAISVDQLTDEVRAYVDARAAACGGKFRLLFMADEVGQFIGSDVNLMLNLQTIVEELGTKCRGRVWVMVTSQEAIDEVTRVAGNDFSKIQGRFNTRLSLSSSSVDEVIRRRVLEKTDAARLQLEADYAGLSAVLKNLFTFDESQSDLRGYASAADFAESYPFVGYQFKLMPNVLAEIRKHGNAGKHLSGGERSMLSGFQEAAQKVQDRDTAALVPFWRFYDTITTFLEHGIRQVIDRCQRAAEESHGLQLQDVEVLKTLYLIRYVNDVKPTVGNIAILMVDDVNADKISLREQVKLSLERLVRENYVARNGDAYSFLTDEEQDVTREINDTEVDVALVLERVKRILFEDICNSRKHRKGANDFPFDRLVDDSPYGPTSNGMKLNVITVAHALAQADDGQLALRSAAQAGQALVVLSTESDYFEALSYAAKVDKYVKRLNVAQLPEGRQSIIRGKQSQARASEKEARAMLEDALLHARCAVAGHAVRPRATTAKQVMEGVLDELVTSTFTKADYVVTPALGDEDLIRALRGEAQPGLAGMGGGNERALEEVAKFLELQHRTHQPTSMGDIHRKFAAAPFGWRELDIAATVARLVADQKAVVREAGKLLDPRDLSDQRRLLKVLREREADQATVQKRELPSAALVSQARGLLSDLTHKAAPEDVDSLTRAVREALQDQEEGCRGLLAKEYARAPYPGKDVVTQGARLAQEILGCASDEKALLKEFTAKEDDLLDWQEDMEKVSGFFPNQQRLFDEARAARELARQESVYLAGDAAAQEAASALDEILGMDAPYERIPKLNELTRAISSAHDEAVRAKRGDVLSLVGAVCDEVRKYAQEADPVGTATSALVADVGERAERLESEVHAARLCKDLDALKSQLEAWRIAQLRSVDNRLVEPQEREAKEPTPRPRKPKTVSRAELCPVKRLTSEDDVDAYVEAIRAKLMEALRDADSVSVR
ncbi:MULTISPECIES: BREX system P-loop protein BrxC [unclassified Adlercreutzia]|uniref:BREX system P-loop protein BrxC n=1 Tax=unclassified Adlercreutzia TaxID=2636013 RepID=UPI0013EC143D|nr:MULTISPECIES: BREX system P-loop protein BrxC [unclassified Adlercreutzia]